MHKIGRYIFKNFVFTKLSNLTTSKQQLEVFVMPFYAVAKGRAPGIFSTWSECESQVKGYTGAKFKKFATVTEAQQFIGANGGGASSIQYNTGNLGGSSTTITSKRKYSSKPVRLGDKSTIQIKSSTALQNKNEKDIDRRLSQLNPENLNDPDEINEAFMRHVTDIEERLEGVRNNVDNLVNRNLTPSKRTILIDPPTNNKRKKTDCNDFDIDDEGFVQVYTDGACSSNGQSGARAGLGVYFGDGHHLNTSQPVSGRATNNCGEIQAATMAIRLAHQQGVQKLCVNTDSQFVINSVTKWMKGWKRNGWKLKSGEPVKNTIDFKDLDSVLKLLSVKWKYVTAHRGVHGNEMADRLAKQGAAAYGK